MHLKIIFRVPIIRKLEHILVFFFIYTHLKRCLGYTNLNAFSSIMHNHILVAKLFQTPKACHISFCFPDTQKYIHSSDICTSLNRLKVQYIYQISNIAHTFSFSSDIANVFSFSKGFVNWSAG